VRQGLGPFVARDLVAAGAGIAGFVGTSAASLEAARRALAEDFGIEARGYLDLDALRAAESPDALAILSPAESHGRWLDAALDARLHVLCEKPLLWDEPDAPGHARRLARGFDAARLVLHENCQWPFTLPEFAALHPGALERPERFAMRLSPASTGRRMLGDAMPHALSLLQALVPAGEARLEEIRFSSRDAAVADLEVRFVYAAPPAAIEARVRLVQGDSLPREAGYAVNGRAVRREVRPPDYRICFVADGREVAVPDPLGRLVGRFVQEVASPPARRSASRTPEIVQRVELLDALLRAWDAG
jgi:hypothetical protein